MVNVEGKASETSKESFLLAFGYLGFESEKDTVFRAMDFVIIFV